MKYDFDSYLLYEVSRMMLYTSRLKVVLNAAVIPETLRGAAEKAFRRFPYFARTVIINEEGAIEFEPCSQPVTVAEEDGVIKLGTEETNGLLFSISYKDNAVFFNFAHNFCGGSGALPWIKSTLWQYFTDLGYDVSPDGIFVPGSPLLEGETDIPDPDTLPSDEPIWEYDAGDSYYSKTDFIGYVLNPSEAQVYTPVYIGMEDLMKYARAKDGSPNSILSALMFKTCSRLFPNASQISGGIVCNYQKDVGCPNTYHDLVRLLHTRYTPKLRDWPVDKLSTVTRGMMYLQMEPESSWKYYRKILAYRDEIDRMPTFRQKQKYASENSPLRAGMRDTFNISYVGNISWGALSEFVTHAYPLTEGHLMLEVFAIGDQFCISFQTLAKSDKYLREFLNVLQEEGIPYTVGETERSNLPHIVLKK